MKKRVRGWQFGKREGNFDKGRKSEKEGKYQHTLK